MNEANERMAAEAQHFGLIEQIRESTWEAVEDMREELAQLLARQSAERDSNDRFWNAASFKDWWECALTERIRESYRKDADQVINKIKDGIR